MVDETDYNEELQSVFLVEHAIHDGRRLSNGNQQTVSEVAICPPVKRWSVSHGGLPRILIAPHP